jgi:hypothetical protein
MNITSQKTSKKKSTRKARSAAESEFDKAWNRVINQQKKNARLKDDVQAFARQVSATIEKQEIAYIQALCQACEHLLSFCNKKSLSLRDREALLDWVTDYLVSISSNPFSTPADVAKLRGAVEAQLFDPQRADEPVIGKQRGESAKRAGKAPPMDDMFEDLFAEPDPEDGFDEAYDDPFEEALFEEFEQQQRAGEKRQAAEGQALKELMKASSINKLFRKLARALHPDRERDESARKEKNRLMGELLHARQTNDIPRIFSLYAEHVGGSPLEELTGDLKGVTQLLQRQYEYLRAQKDAIIGEEPFSAAMYRRFYQKSEYKVQRALSAYVADLKEETREVHRLCKEVTTLARLKRYLAPRRNEIDLEHLFGF